MKRGGRSYLCRGPDWTLWVRLRQCCCPGSGAVVFSRHERSSVCLLAGWRVLAWLLRRVSGLHDARRIPAGPPGASTRSVRGFVGGAHSGGSKGGRVGGGVKRRDLVRQSFPRANSSCAPEAGLCQRPTSEVPCTEHVPSH